MSELNRNESFERFEEGLKCAASCAKELSGINPQWKDVAKLLASLRFTGKELAKARPLTKQEVDHLLIKHRKEVAH